MPYEGWILTLIAGGANRRIDAHIREPVCAILGSAPHLDCGREPMDRHHLAVGAVRARHRELEICRLQQLEVGM